MQRPHTLKPILLNGQDTEEKRAQIKAYFNNSWLQYESLFSNINNQEAFFVKAERLRHPLIFYFGHTACFYINKLILGKFITSRINTHIESTCAVGVDEMSWDDLDSKNYDWPSVNEVITYRHQVYELVNQLIDTMPIELPITQNSLAWIILMGIEHERIHLETSSVIIRMLPTEDLSMQPGWEPCPKMDIAPENQLIPIEGQAVTLGKPDSNQTYGWDNEYGALEVNVKEFKVSEYLVSNQEFLAFVEAGGYQKSELWSAEGKAWLASTKAEYPRFWQIRHGEYWQRNLGQEVPLPLNWPVEVNYLEAKAFCNWKSQQNNTFIRLPTEAEWQVLRQSVEEDLTTWACAPGNINLEHYASSCPVNQFKAGPLYDVIGNVWQWTESPIDAFPGFKVHPLYDDFSTPTFDGKHNLIKGGSWISTGNEAVKDSRYAFRRHFFQHAGFRYIESSDAQIPVTPVTPYEMDAEISQALHKHYGETPLGLGNPLQLTVEKVMRLFNGEQSKALDLGCGVGRASFELAKHFKHVDGIDFTARNIQHALALLEKKPVRFALQDEGEIVKFFECSLASSGLTSGAGTVDFYQGDGHNLKPQFTGYDLILCSQLIDCLYEPKRLLKEIKSRLALGGVLAISSAYQWDNQTSGKDAWLGGFKVNGENLSGRDGLTLLLEKEFTLLGEDSIEVAEAINTRRVAIEHTELTLWQLKGE